MYILEFAQRKENKHMRSVDYISLVSNILVILLVKGDFNFKKLSVDTFLRIYMVNLKKNDENI